MTQELFRRANPTSVVELQGAFVREYLEALMEGGTTTSCAPRAAPPTRRCARSSGTASSAAEPSIGTVASRAREWRR